MWNQNFAHSLFSVVGMTESAALAESDRVRVAVSDESFTAEGRVHIALSISDRHFEVVMAGLDMPYDQRPLRINQQVVDDPAARGVACMLIDSFLYDYRAYQSAAMAN